MCTNSLSWWQIKWNYRKEHQLKSIIVL